MLRARYEFELRKRRVEFIRKQRVTAIVVVILANEIIKKQKRSYKKKVKWIADIYANRYKYGFYFTTFPCLKLDSIKFKNYFRMGACEFEELVCLVGPRLYKQYVVREPISVDERLSITLRYLASGDSMISMSYHHLIGATTATTIIYETCQVLWEILSPVVLKPCYQDDWRKIAVQFENKWQFPNCIGALDGKHVLIQCPNKAGSSNYNYKSSHSIVLMALCDANYIFKSVDIGAPGRRSDGGIFKDTILGMKLEENAMDLPEPRKLCIDGPKYPYVIVADEAFPLSPYLMRPYPADNLTTEKRIYNYRLSRARRMIENTFGILVNQWRIFRKPIIASPNHIISMIQATICLHNWLRMKDFNGGDYVTPEMVDKENEDHSLSLGSWRELGENSAFENFTKCNSRTFSKKSGIIREDFCDYFNNEGGIQWQFAQIYK